MSVERSGLSGERSASRGAVFLSYASQDAAAVERIAEALRAAGVEVWFDRNELVGGDAWDAKIRKQIAECALFVPVISASTQARKEGYFRLEWRLAAQRTHMMSEQIAFLLPVVIDATRDAEADVPAEFKAVQWMRLPGGETNEAYCARVKTLLDRDAVETGAPGPAAAARGNRLAGGRSAVSPWRESGQARPWWKRYAVIAGISIGLIYAVKSVVTPRQTGAEKPASAARPEPAAPASAGAAPGASSALADVLAKVRRLRVKIDVTRAELEAATGLLEQADQQHPNQPDIWAEWSLVDARFVDERLDSSDARREAMRQRAQRAYGLAPEAPAARLAQAQALTILNWGDAAALAQAKALLEPLAARPDVDPGALLLLSLVSRERTNPEASFRYLDRLAQMPGGAVQAHLARGIALVFAERWADAEVEIDRALALERAGMLHMWKSYIQAMWHGDMPGAQRSVAAIPATFLQEDFPAAACFWVHLWSQDWDKALAVMRAVPRDYIDSGALSGPTAYFRGWVLARAGKPAAAENELRAALDVVEARRKAKPNLRSLLVAKALVLVSLGQREQAASLRRLVVELHGEAPETWMDNFLTAELLPVEEAIRALAKQAETSAFTTTARLRIDPYLDRLRGHPDFAALQARAEADPRLSPAARARAGVAKPAATRADAMPAPVPEKSVAVLAFDNLSDDKANEYFSDGISEELLTVLQKIPGLKVAARTSAWSFKGKNPTAKEVGERLGMAHVVEGSVQKSGNKVKITARLSRAATNEEVWSKSYGPLELTNVFATQSEIATAIVSELRGRLAGEVASGAQSEIAAQVQAATKGGTKQPEAHQHYLQGRFLATQFSQENFARAVGHFRRATELDASFALAWAALSRTQSVRWAWGALAGDAEAILGEARRAANRALALEPDLAEGHAASFEAQVAFEFDWRGAEASARKALVLAPADAANLCNAAKIALFTGRIDEALGLIRRAAALDPVNTEVLLYVGAILFQARRHDEAAAELQRALAINPNATALNEQASNNAVLRGRLDEAQAFAEREQEPWARRTAFGILRWAQRQQPQADAALREIVEHHATDAAFNIAEVYAFRGEADQALAWLERAYRQRDAGIAWCKVDPMFEKLRTDPRWPAFLKKIGLHDDQLK